MLIITGDDIKLTRGDSLIVELELEKGGETYTPQQGDSLRFAVSTGYKGQVGYTLHISKPISPEDLVIHLDPEDTEDLAYKKYHYDVEMTYVDGEVDTCLSGDFELTGDVE